MGGVGRVCDIDKSPPTLPHVLVRGIGGVLYQWPVLFLGELCKIYRSPHTEALTCSCVGLAVSRT